MNEEKRRLLGIKNGFGLKAILDEASEILNNPILMIDVTYKLLANSENTVTDDPIWNEIVSLKRFSHETVNFFRAERFIEAYAQCDLSTLMKTDKLKYDRITSVIFDDLGEQLGSICMLACYRPPKDEDNLLLSIVCDILSRELQKADSKYNIVRAYEQSIIGDLLEKKSIKSVAKKSALQDVYMGLKPNLFAIAVDITQYDPSLTHLAYFKEELKSIQPEYKYFTYLNNIIIIMGADSVVFSVEKELGRLNSFFKGNQLYAGISGSFQSLNDIKVHYRQALSALNYGLSLNNGRNIFKHDDFRGELYLVKRLDSVNVSNVCHPILFCIIEHDKKNNTNYLEILYNYLQTGGSAELASSIVSLDVKEFLSRFNEIVKLFDIDLTNGDMLASIFRSIKLFKTIPEKFQKN